MNSQLLLLVELQKLDLKIHNIRKQCQNIPERIHAAQSPLLEGKRRLEDLTGTLARISTERRSSEQDLSVQEAQIQKLRSRLTELKTNKEYQAHLFEIEQANKKKDALEDKVLLVMERGEQKQQEQSQLHIQIAEAETAFEQEKTHLESLKIQLETELGQLEQQRQAVMGQVGKDILAQYLKLKTKLNVLALVPVRDGTCEGCRLQLPPQLVAEVKRGQELLSCAYCHRILYWEGSLDDLGLVDADKEETPNQSISS